MYFRDYGLAKRPFNKYLKNAVSQYLSKRNMVKALKHILNYHSGTFITLIDHR